MTRIFTLDESRRLLPDVMRLTGRYREEMEHVWGRLKSDDDVAPTYHLLDRLKSRWIASIRETGAIPMRLWEIAFDSGDGFFWSWRIGEDDVRYMHRHRPIEGTRFIKREEIMKWAA